MKTESNYIDYGIYIERKKAFIISLNHIVHEALIEEAVEESHGTVNDGVDANQERHIQNHKNEELKKFCKTIIEKIEHPHSILIFGPSVSKFELQKEIQECKRLKNVHEELLVSDVLDKHAALQFVQNHFTSVTVGQQVFTIAKKD